MGRVRGIFGQPIQQRLLVLRRPDVVEHRGEGVLLVWGDIPHWMVVDEEMKAFLFLFETPQRFFELIAGNSRLRPYKKELLSVVKDLVKKGVVVRSRHADSAESKQPVSSPPIENIAWNLTHKCNLRCRHCYYADSLNDSKGDELSAKEVIEFLKSVKPFVSRRATLTVLGGEPLLYPDKLIEVCRFARKTRMIPLVSTNGTLIDDAFAKDAKRIGLEVQVSLDGPNAEVNDPLRGAGTFEKIRRGVATLTAHGVHTVLSMVCCRSNFDSLRGFMDLAVEWGVDEARFIPLKQMGGAKSEAMEMVSHYEIVTKAYQLLKENPAYRELLGRDCLSILANTCRYSARRDSCGTGTQTFLLDADGGLYPCLNLNQPAYAFGNIRNELFRFEDIWDKCTILDDVRACVNVNNSERPCSVCPVRHWCLGGCRGETVVNTGDLKPRSIHCGDLRKTILEVLWILAENPGMIKTLEQIG